MNQQGTFGKQFRGVGGAVKLLAREAGYSTLGISTRTTAGGELTLRNITEVVADKTVRQRP
ncbi:MAG: hypothetical protein U1F34_07040 [Gammaproteobacteria bacterium]